MNLALKDIRFGLGRFLLTVVGVGFLITASVGMVGLYRGIVDDALLIIDRIGADLWVVQGGRAGPFAEGSAISSTMDRRVEGLPGVDRVRRYVQSSQQFEFAGRLRRATVTGLDYPADGGGWLPLIRGRHLASGHFEAIADVSLDVAQGDRIRLGQDDYTIVGITSGMVDMQGDSLLFVTVSDAMAIARRRTSEEVLLARASSGRVPAEAGTGTSSVEQESKIAAVLTTLSPAADADRIEATIEGWGDANVLSRADQHDLLLNQRLWRLRIQILAFTVVLLAVMAIVISLIIYTMTIEKLHQIAMLKLIGARNSVIVGMIAQQAGLVGSGGFVFGVGMAYVIFPFFPRRVVIDLPDLALLFLAVAAISAFASVVGIRRAMKVRAQEVLS
ncbi:putative ABC transport system permease protein [Rhodobium orientis]|uniref:Multidrug ABC transporter substrate-binding protein n=1 Tax=Rhodobium orientis TaxID=34017 RepID=A0A327JVH3_9HYPH|nr:ABC transporter permease [Rhodobium orientis]MBB4303980.1 putative ABC transport system permease protein [Rhodobium orientis]MBK5950810.1 multidrug ABC transporter substrate-binding protein [Rhodobium orientis]RAI29524.1 multidrug ABC transporter substrate-binding protein [Rhodobium orientis]